MDSKAGTPGSKVLGAIRFGDFKLDLVEEVLRRGGDRVNINPRMFQVLRLLVERHGEIVTKDEFFEKVWGGSFVEDNNLSVTITALRKVLGDNAKQPRFIENVPRKGYRFVAAIEPVTMVPVHPVADRPVRATKTKWNTLRIASVSALLLLLVGAAAYSYRALGKLGVAPRTIDSVAVLPFFSSDPELEYISDGISESVANRLRVYPDLRVTDHRAVSEYRGKDYEAVAAGRELGVAAVLTGRVEKSGEAVTVRVELTQVADGYVIWKQESSGSARDVLSLQRNLADTLTAAVFPSSSGKDRDRRSERMTSDPEAYDLYIRGRYLWNKRIDSEIFRSIELFRAAIDKDPAFAKAYVALANSYSLVGLKHHGISDEERANLAIATAEKAIELDETLGEAYAVKAVNKSFIKWDLAGAYSDYRRAIELDPNDATSHHWFAEFLAMHGRFDESIALYQRAMELDPLSSAIRTDYALTFYYSRNFDRAIELLNKEKVLHPNYARTYLFLYFIYPEKGMYAEALDAMETHVDVVYRAGGRSVDWYEDLKAKLAKRRASLTVGARGFWERTLIDAENEPYPTAVAYAKLGDKDRAFEYLEKAFAARYTGMVWLKVTPELDSLRDDPRFDTLLRRVGFE